jgi:hypothetical protein
MKQEWISLNLRLTKDLNSACKEQQMKLQKSTGEHISKNEFIREAIRVALCHPNEFFKGGSNT